MRAQYVADRRPGLMSCVRSINGDGCVIVTLSLVLIVGDKLH